jgi:hypothetical protein
MVSVRHATQVSGTNNPDKQVSVDVWNESHSITGTAGKVLGFSATGAATELDAGLSVANRSDLAASPTGIHVFLRESGREGLFVFDGSDLSAKVSADPGQGIYVAKSTDGTGASGAWVRVWDGSRAFAKWWGGTWDGTTNDGPTVLAAVATLVALKGTITNPGEYGPEACPSLVLPFAPNGINMNASTLTLNQAMAIYGENGATFGGGATWLKWAAGHTGIVINAENCYLDGLALQGGWTGSSTAEGEYHGIQAKYKFGYGRLFITNWQGDGIYARTDVDGGNCNGMYGVSATINNCRNGVRLGGNDSNAGWFGLLDLNYNRQAGLYVTDGFGNGFSVVQTAGNGVQGISGTAPVCVFNNGHIFTVKIGQASGASTNSPPSTATSNTWWIYWKDAGAATSYAPQWVSGTTYREGGAVLVNGGSSATTISHLYTEADQPPVQLDQAAVVRGGLVASGYATNTPRVYAGSGVINIAPAAIVTGNITQNQPGSGQLLISGVTAAYDPLLVLKTGSTQSQIQFQGSDATIKASITAFNAFGMYLDGVLGVHFRYNGTDIAQITSGGFDLFSGKVLSNNGTTIINGSGVLQAAGFPALTGDVTTSAGSLATTLGTVAGAIKTSSATAGVGYATGAGGAVTQATSRTTGVTLNKVCGAITLVSAAGSTSWQTFTVTNSAVAATDVIRVSQKSGTDKYMIHVTAVGSGTFDISFATTGGTTTEQPVFNFAVVKAVAA